MEQETALESPVAEADLHDIRATLNGDQDAFERLVERYEADVFAQMWRFTRDRRVLDELVQDAFVEVYLSLGKFRGRAPFLHWVRRIATRAGYQHWKRESRARRRERALPEWWADKPPVEEQTPGEAAERLHQLLETLEPRDRLVLTLFYLEELNSNEIAQRMGWSPTLVRVRVHRALRKLRRCLETENPGRGSHV